MNIVNFASYGEKTYIVSLGTGTAWTEQFQVAAYDEQSAVDAVADHLVYEHAINLYYDHLELDVIASCTEYKTAETYADAHNLTCCGNYGIYIELLNIEEVAE